MVKLGRVVQSYWAAQVGLGLDLWMHRRDSDKSAFATGFAFCLSDLSK